MNKLKLSLGVLLAGSIALATTFGACSSKSNTATPGTGGTGGGGSTGAAGSHVDGGPATLTDGKCVPGAFAHDGACVCQSDTPTVCEDMCTDTTIDDANCGTCGKACAATSTCNASNCGPAATSIVPAIAGCTAMNIALSGTTLYFTDTVHGTVNSVATTGGAVTALASTEVMPGYVAVNGTNLLWISVVSQTAVEVVDGGVVDGGSDAAVDGGLPGTLTTASIRKMTIPGGTPTTLVTETNTNGGIQSFTFSPDGATVYYSSDTKVKSIAVAAATGTAGTDIVHEEHGGIPTFIGISADGMTLAYVTKLNGDVDVITLKAGVLARCGMNLPGTDNLDPAQQIDCERIARSQGSPFYGAMILQNGNAYWSNDSAIQVNGSGADAGQANEQIAPTAAGMPVTALAGNATTIYFAEDGFIEKTPYVVGSTALEISRAQKAPSSIALDATKVYWSTGDCSINSIAQ